ncbi:MAG: hypothetical protein KC964_29640, partial [Candidatus Omnitrophica bacterium]|nr:hypothetical protein [Candidatus Omnitrophota bacterium]
MSDYLEKNLESLQKRFPVLAQRLAETESDGTVRIESASTGDPTAAYLLPNGGEKRLHSSRDPKREAHRWAESIALKQNETVALFGPGLGYPIEALGQVHGDKLGGMWIFEGSIHVFRAMLSLKDWTWLIDQP